MQEKVDLSRRRSGGARGGGGAPSVVAAGSVWESRMKIDEVKGGFKVFNANNNNNNNSEENASTSTTSLKTNPKRKTWNSDTSQRSPIIHIARGKTEEDQQKRTPIQPRKRVVFRSESTKEIQTSPVRKEAKEEREKSPVEIGSCEEEEEEEEEALKLDEGIEVEKIKEIKSQEAKPEEVKAVQDDKPANLVNAAEKVVVVSEVKRVTFERKLEVQPHNNNNNITKNNSKIFHQKQSQPISLNVKRRPPPVIKRATIHSSFASKPGSPTKSHSNSDAYHSFPESHSRLQSFVDLIMWKDISRSVFIFGIGTFTILSSSYTKDLNISFISVISYLGLVYLAAIFLFRSVVCRGVIDMNHTSYVLGEEEAIWLLKLVLPYLNEFLLKLKALFSGDPATTMKLAALLFILARCGSSITIWTMAKLGFFGVFTVPKVCSLYSTYITAYAKFWVRRFRDAWDSCSHKKGVTIGVFLLIWNLSSIVARIWAVFMLFVAFRYYQQNIVGDDWVEDGPEVEETWHEPIGVQKHGPATLDHTKQKKRS